jgi:hypothetical protein
MGAENRKDEPEGVRIGSEVGSKERLPEKAIAVTNCNRWRGKEDLRDDQLFMLQ